MTNYLVIGSGRWATHLLKSLAIAGLPHQNWARKTHSESNLGSKLRNATHVWLAISDSALNEWADRLQGFSGQLLHSSGALEIKGVHSVHPLMSFGPHLYPEAFYRKYAFVTTSELTREQLLPGFPNPVVRISNEQKTFYHAMCVLAGNGSVLLWQKFFSEMKALGIPLESASLYTQQVSENITQRPTTALTGPLVRNDQITLNKDLESMQGDAFAPVLEALIEAYRKVGKELV